MANYKHYARVDPTRLDINGKKRVVYFWSSWEYPDRFDNVGDLLSTYTDDIEIYNGVNRHVTVPTLADGQEYALNGITVIIYSPTEDEQNVVVIAKRKLAYQADSDDLMADWIAETQIAEKAETGVVIKTPAQLDAMRDAWLDSRAGVKTTIPIVSTQQS